MVVLIMGQLSDLGAELNILARPGFTVGPFEFEWTDENEAILNISTYVFDRAVFISRTNQTQVGDFDIAFVTNGTDGKWNMEITPTDSAAIGTGKFFYTVGATIGSRRIPVLYGQLELRP